MKLKCPLTLQIWFFASEVSHHSLQLTQLTMGRVNVCLAVGPTSNTQSKMYCSHIFKKSYKQQHWWETHMVYMLCFLYGYSIHHSLANVRSGASKSWRPEEKRKKKNMKEGVRQTDTNTEKLRQKNLPSSTETFPMKMYCPYPLVNTIPRLSRRERRQCYFTTHYITCQRQNKSCSE